MGSFAVTSIPVSNFAGWAATANAKILVGDFNGDGKADVAITGPSGWNNLPVAFSNGDGTFNITNAVTANFAGWAATTNANILVGDFNGDGKTDLAITGPSGWNNLPVAFSNGDGTFNVTNAAAGSFPGWAATLNAKPLVGDFNGDGKTDVALTGPSGWNNLPVAFSKGDGTFNVTNSPAGNFPGWAATTNAKILVGDFNADGKTDLAITGPSGWNNLPVAFSNGDGTFNITNQPITNFNGWASTANATPLVGNFSGDGKTDVALTGPSGWNNMPVAFSNGDGTFKVTNDPVGNFNIWAATQNAKPLVGDFNGDGKTDVALSGPAGWNNLPVAFSNGDGTFNVTNQPTSSSSQRDTR